MHKRIQRILASAFVAFAMMLPATQPARTSFADELSYDPSHQALDQEQDAVGDAEDLEIELGDIPTESEAESETAEDEETLLEEVPATEDSVTVQSSDDEEQQGLEVMEVQDSVDVVNANSDDDMEVVVQETPEQDVERSAALQGRARTYGSTLGAWSSADTTSITLGNGKDPISQFALRPVLTGLTGNVRYRAFVSNKGWQGWTTSPKTTGASSQTVEAVRLELTGNISQDYDLYYRVKIKGKGWQGWTKNGKLAGSMRLGRAIVALEVRLVMHGDQAPELGEAFLESGLTAQGYVQNVGLQKQKTGFSVTIGTSGRSLRLEAFCLNRPANEDITGSIVYQARVQGEGWQKQRKNGALAGTKDKGRRIEAVRISLTGDLAAKYDIWYRLHVEGIGWMGWASNGSSAGTQGLGLRTETMQVALVQKGGTHPASDNDATSTTFFSSTNVKYGSLVAGAWQGYKNSGKTSGTTGKSQTIAAVRMKGSVAYRIKPVGKGWTSWQKNDTQAGTAATKVEALKVKLTGEYAKYCDVWYRVHVSGIGWLSWTKNGKVAGSNGAGLTAEAYQIKVTKKGASAPGSTKLPYAIKVSGDKDLDTILNTIYRTTGRSGKKSLKKAYDYVAGSRFTYFKQNLWPKGKWKTWSKSYAKEFWKNKGGNCYRYTSLMCWLALGMGYDASIYCGQVPAAAGGLAAHGWVEIRSGGTVYVVDPDLQQNIPSRNFFWQTYSGAPLAYYTPQGVELT